MGIALFAPAPVSPVRGKTTAKPDWSAVLARCFDRHGPAVYGLAQRITGNEEVAARLTAEVFAGLEEITDEAALGHCVLADVHRRAVAWARTAPPPPAGGISLEALQVLSAAEREVIGAAYFGGLTYAAVAERLDLPLAEVITLMQQGLRRLAAFTPAASAP